MDTAIKLTKKDFQTENEIRWCPGCGDYSIIAAVQKVLPELGIPKENIIFISGIGCSSRFPYYMNTYGFHTIHGRAPAVATGVKMARPELQVWVTTGDGDGLAIGGNHFIHAMRRNIDLKVILFNNRIYGLTKGQCSPTSEKGKKTKSTPYGSIDKPFNPLQVALGTGATFVARSVDADPVHLGQVIARAAKHKGIAFVEVIQNCVVFNDGAFSHLTDKPNRDAHLIRLEQGKPVTFEKGKKGVRMGGFELSLVNVGDGGEKPEQLLTWNEKASPALSMAMSEFMDPLAIGVFRDVEEPTLEQSEQDLQRQVRETKGVGDLHKLLRSGETWKVT
jgi:2-oxoglutarate/2-oxoacid ferredoxin oxidoreductase subunit beta